MPTGPGWPGIGIMMAQRPRLEPNTMEQQYYVNEMIPNDILLYSDIGALATSPSEGFPPDVDGRKYRDPQADMMPRA